MVTAAQTIDPDRTVEFCPVETRPAQPGLTQVGEAQIDAGQVVYVHNGSNTTSDSITFTVDDGEATGELPGEVLDRREKDKRPATEEQGS